MGASCSDPHHAETNKTRRLISEQSLTGTVWDNIKPTQENWVGTNLPKSFELQAGNMRFWVQPNATKHILEDLTKMGPSYSNAINTQQWLTSFQRAVIKMTQSPIVYDIVIKVDNWEFMVGHPRSEGLLDVIYHARTLYK